MPQLTLQPITESKKSAQRELILRMLKIGDCNCSDFLKKGIAQYNARIFELRKQGKVDGFSIVYNSLTKNFVFSFFKKKRCIS